MSNHPHSKSGRLLSIFILVALLLAACQPAVESPVPLIETAAPQSEVAVATEAPASPATEEPKPPEKIKLVFWSHDYPPRERLDRKIMAQFMEANPNVEIEYIIGPGDDSQYIVKLMTAYAGGEAPDCFNLIDMYVGQVFDKEMVVPLDPKAYGVENQDELIAQYIPGTLNQLIHNGTLYAVPAEEGTVSMYLNTQMFADAGLDPVNDYPMTWEQLLEVAPKLTKMEGDRFVQRSYEFAYGGADELVMSAVYVAGMAFQAGGTVLNADKTEATVNTEPWKKTFQYVYDYAYKYKFGGPGNTPSINAFIEGSSAMTAQGPWYKAYLKDMNSVAVDNLIVMPVPRWQDAVNKTGIFNYTYGQYVNALTTPEKQAVCQALIAEMATKHHEEYLTEADIIQPAISLTQSDAFKNKPFIDVFISDMTNTPGWPVIPKSFELYDSLNRALQRVMTNQQSIDEALNQAKEEMDAILK